MTIVVVTDRILCQGHQNGVTYKAIIALNRSWIEHDANNNTDNHTTPNTYLFFATNCSKILTIIE